MKVNRVLAVLALATGLSAMAGPVIPLPEGPLYIKFDNREQIAIAPGAVTLAGTNEINWGVLTVSSANKGSSNIPNVIDPIGAAFFNNISSHNAQVTGIFYGIEGLPAGTGGNPFPATKGFLDLYWRDLSLFPVTNLALAPPTIRTSQSTAIGFTEGDLLVRLKFASGIISTDPSVFIAGTVVPTAGGFSGLATSFAEVDTSVVGAWTETLDTDWFSTAFGARDFSFRNIYDNLSSWNGGPGIVGARSTDPATAFAVPEPTTMALVGLSLFGLGFARRRKGL